MESAACHRNLCAFRHDVEIPRETGDLIELDWTVAFDEGPSSWGRLREKENPHRYLTLANDAGVVFTGM